MNSYSQVGQDLFAWETAGKTDFGTFLDVGCHDGNHHSNSLALEEIGWKGLLLDMFHYPGIETRRSPLVIADALTVDWKALIGEHFTKSFITYLSLDVDESTTEVLERILATPAAFGRITVETDVYRLGTKFRDRQRKLLRGLGYRLHTGDVPVGPGPWGKGGPFEDWWIAV